MEGWEYWLIFQKRKITLNNSYENIKWLSTIGEAYYKIDQNTQNVPCKGIFQLVTITVIRRNSVQNIMKIVSQDIKDYI